ncbi:hypothetical protein ACFOD9_04395 [Novosphingobium bradum]|uniref:Uncharacterized protein n=1 Tax=Novosphingobium bradum TaxID=1737444 RepID=A0ABV7IPH3_9SPHN
MNPVDFIPKREDARLKVAPNQALTPLPAKNFVPRLFCWNKANTQTAWLTFPVSAN